MPNLALKQVFQHIKQQTPLVVRFVSLAFQSAFNHAYLNPELHRQLKEIDTHLSAYAYFAGDVFSYADILMWFPLYAASYATPQFAQYQSIQHYFTQIQSRPAFNAAMTCGQWSASYFEHYWSITQ